MRTARSCAVMTVMAVLVAACSSGDDAATSQPTGSVDTEASIPTDTASPVTTPTTEATVESSVTDPPDTDPLPEPTDAPPSELQDFSAIGPIVQDFVDTKGLNGAGLIIVDADADPIAGAAAGFADGVVYEGYWGEFDADRISLIASSTKMITAGVLLRLQDDGLLDIDAPIAGIVDWGQGNPDITTAQLLSNSSGLVGLGPNPAYGPYLCQFVTDGTLEDCATTVFETPDDDADVIAPDSEFRYGGAQWQVAGGVAEAVSGRTWAELVDEIYVQPCGLTTLGYNNHFSQFPLGFDYPQEFGADPATLIATANPSMEGGAYITTGDYAKLLLMHLRDGRCGDDQVLSTAALDTLHADRIGTAYDGAAGGPETGYGMGWWIDRESGRLSDPGLYGAVPWLDLEDGYGAYLVVEADAVAGAELASLLYDVVEDAMNTPG